MPFLILDEIAEVAGDIHLEFVKVMPQERMSKHWLVRIIESSVAWFGRRLWRVVHIISLGVVTVNAEEHISEFFFFLRETDRARLGRVFSCRGAGACDGSEEKLNEPSVQWSCDGFPSCSHPRVFEWLIFEFFSGLI